MGRVDWLKATPEQRARLYHVAKAVIDLNNMTPADFYHMTLGDRNLDPASTHANFSRGSLGRRNAARIYSWIAENHEDIGLSIAPDLFENRDPAAWLHFLAAREKYGGLQIIKPPSRGIVRPAHIRPIADLRIRLGEEFLFSLNSTLNGSAFAMQFVKDHWHLFALGAVRNARLLPLVAGEHILPIGPDGRPYPLNETDSTDLHSFVIGIFQAPSSIEEGIARLAARGLKSEELGELADLIEQQPDSHVEIHRINVIFF